MPIVCDGVHSTLLEHVAGGRVDPHMIWSCPRLMFLSHTVGSPDVKPLQPRQCGLCEVPCLAAVEEDRLHNRLVEHGADLWRSLIRLEDLSYPGPCPTSLLDLVLHCPDVLIILCKNLPEVTKRLDPLLGCLFLQESSRFLFFPFLSLVLNRNHDSCSAGILAGRTSESGLYGAYIGCYIGNEFVKRTYVLTT